MHSLSTHTGAWEQRTSALPRGRATRNCLWRARARSRIINHSQPLMIALGVSRCWNTEKRRNFPRTRIMWHACAVPTFSVLHILNEGRVRATTAGFDSFSRASSLFGRNTGGRGVESVPVHVYRQRWGQWRGGGGGNGKASLRRICRAVTFRSSELLLVSFCVLYLTMKKIRIRGGCGSANKMDYQREKGGNEEW